ncbi:MAG: MlaE family lipid ABC transporter permease subunit [Bacteroidota bacterium]
MSKKSKSPSDFYSVEYRTTDVLVRLQGTMSLYTSRNFESIKQLIRLKNDISKLTFDFSGVNSYDTFLIVFVEYFQNQCRAKSIETDFTGMSDDMLRFVKILSQKESGSGSKKKKIGFWTEYFSHVGFMTITILTDMKLFLEFIGDMLIKIIGLFAHPRKMRWKDFPYHFTRAGVTAVPIVVLIVFLIGVISGYQGAVQLHQFGADIYIADLIGISITRELGPLMTAILVAGRSGSAYAAEIGTMKVSEEVDALTSMGFNTMHFLVLPRVLAVMFAMPFLVIIADLAGITGGFLTANTTLRITLSGYLNELQTALHFWDVFTGLMKSLVFGFLVATVGCFRGMQVHGGAESVGKFTTTAVVSGVLLIILADAIFTFIFQALGI